MRVIVDLNDGLVAGQLEEVAMPQLYEQLERMANELMAGALDGTVQDAHGNTWLTFHVWAVDRRT